MADQAASTAPKEQEMLDDEAEFGIEIDIDALHRAIGRKPRPPSPSQCCGEGCVNCVLDVYETRLERWQERKRKYLEELRQQRQQQQE